MQRLEIACSISIQDADVEDEETVLELLAQYEVYRIEENMKSCQKLLSYLVRVIYLCRSCGGFGREISNSWKGAQVEFTILFDFLRMHRRWAFL